MASSSPPKFSRFDLPGFTLPVNFTPTEGHKKKVYNKWGQVHEEADGQPSGEGRELFRSALLPDENRGYSLLPLTTLREFTMVQMMNMITDKPDWEIKVFDDEIVAKWEAESHGASQSGALDMSPNMFKWVMEELRYKAKIFHQTKAVSLYSGDIVKSDSAIPESLKEALRSAVAPLENVLDVYKDYHPGSDEKVIDLVHPSLFPLIYGRSRIIPDKLVGLDDCLEMIGLGKILPLPSEDETKYEAFPHTYNASGTPFSRNYQWLPCEVEFSGPDKEVKITSYINNLHPRKHQSLYTVVEKIMSHAIPLWNLTLTPLKDEDFLWKRIKFEGPKYDPDPDRMPAKDRPQQEEGESEDDFYERTSQWEEEFRRTHLVLPEPLATFSLPDKTLESDADEAVDLKRDYGHRGLQVIVKLATISLTPEKSSYEGGSWHVEGQMNEHICATALYYYDSNNITESRLAFRQQSNPEDTMELDYAQCDWVWAQPILGIENEQSCVQVAGDVVCREGRLLTFPNILQHRVSPFELADPTKPGHRKILALFLVDPNIRVVSTANVPPQQRDWWSEELKATGCFTQLAPELQEKVFEGVEDFPIGLEEAKEIRLRLMDERKGYVVQQNEGFQNVTFSLCEH